MTPLVELVPNVSEGRDASVIEDIAAALGGVPGARLLHVDPDHDTHRTVMTVVGEPEAVLEAAFQGVARAVDRIDLRRHQGTHPRMGAADVLPFVPWSGLDMAACVALARRLGARVGEELGVPGWLYGEAATAPERRLLHEVRRGGFEGLAARMATQAPDFGPATPHPRAGASAVGARGVLIAFNVNLRGPGLDGAALLARARGLARALRELPGPGRAPARRLPAVRALGWLAPSHGVAQLTTNLVDWRVTPPHVLFEAAREEAAARGLEVDGSELVGMIPLGALLAAGRHYGGGDPVEAAVRGLGLDRLRPFDPQARVLEFALELGR